MATKNDKSTAGGTTSSNNNLMSDSPPSMSPWNGALRFSLEVASLVGLGHWAYIMASASSFKLLAAVSLPLVAAAAWGTWNVPNDPSRGAGGEVAIPVSGVTRLVVEAIVLGSGFLALWQWNAISGGTFCLATTVHYVSYYERIQWLWIQR